MSKKQLEFKVGRNPYSQAHNPVSFSGWENGYNEQPNYSPSQFEKDEYGPRYWKAFNEGNKARHE